MPTKYPVLGTSADQKEKLRYESGYFRARPESSYKFDERAPAEWHPAVDVFENENSHIIQVELAGVDRENISVTRVDNVITISGERHLEYGGETGGYRLQEFRYGKFNRTISLPPTLDFESTSARYTNGVLVVTIPKEHATIRKSQPGETPESFQPGPDKEDLMDSNYRAYLRDVDELEKTFAGFIVAYADGRRIAEGKDAQELIGKIPEDYRRRSLFIKDVRERPVQFRRPFFIRDE